MQTQKHPWLGGNQRIGPTFCLKVAERDQCPLRCFLGDSWWIKHDRTANLWIPQTWARLCHPPTPQQGGQLMSQRPQGQTPDGEKEGCRGHSSMTGLYELAFHSMKMFFWLRWSCPAETARMLKKDFSFCLLRQPQLKTRPTTTTVSLATTSASYVLHLTICCSPPT